MVLYIGVTNNILRRAQEHKEEKIKGFTEKYKVNKLVYFEHHEDINTAIAREKQLKDWKRMWKIELIEKNNPSWNDLYETLK
jgi:putative endonuclease